MPPLCDVHEPVLSPKNKWSSQQRDKKFKNKHRKFKREKRKNVHANRRGCLKLDCVADRSEFHLNCIQPDAEATGHARKPKPRLTGVKSKCSSAPAPDPALVPRAPRAPLTSSATPAATPAPPTTKFSAPGVIILPARFKPEDYKQRPAAEDMLQLSPQRVEKCPLTPAQNKALSRIKTYSKRESARLRNKLKTRLQALGFGSDALTQLQTFMARKVHVTMRVPSRVITMHLIEDQFLRNLFETGTGGGNKNQDVRRGWETRMFAGAYDAGKVVERPKYGCLNVSMGPKGCERSMQYGECYFKMRDETCRWRTTFAQKDSSCADAELGVLEDCCHVLCKFVDDDLKHVMNVARLQLNSNVVMNGKQNCKRKGKMERSRDEVVAGMQTCYKEVQIHGDVRTDRDVEQLWVPKRLERDGKIKAFVRKYKIELKVF